MSAERGLQCKRQEDLRPRVRGGLNHVPVPRMPFCAPTRSCHRQRGDVPPCALQIAWWIMMLWIAFMILGDGVLATFIFSLEKQLEGALANTVRVDQWRCSSTQVKVIACAGRLTHPSVRMAGW